MKTTGVKPTDAAMWSNTWSDSRYKESGSRSEATSGEPGAETAAAPARTDGMTFSEKLAESQTPPPADPRIKQLLDKVEDSNDKMKETLQSIKNLRVETVPVPSAIGLSVGAAASKLKNSELKVGSVTQEFSLTVPEGHVISQIPGPGSRTVRRGGIRLVISKGTPPDKEKYDTRRMREQVHPLETTELGGDSASNSRFAPVPVNLTTVDLDA